MNRFVTATATAMALVCTSCGLPAGGDVRTVDDTEVPYRLLEPETPSSAPSAGAGPRPRTPVVLWVSGDRLTPETADGACTEEPEALTERLLGQLTSGPSEEARAAGRSSAVPVDFGLELVGISEGTAEVNIEPSASMSAEQLPLAVGQIVL